VRIYDDLYGLIDFSEKERDVIDHPYFQRLRRINQLALAHYVFPGATHTRLAHSLGVAHLMQKVIENLANKSVKGRAIEINEDEERNLRTAALLHDIGHFPLSHSLESVYEGELENLVKDAERKVINRDQDFSALERYLAGTMEQNDLHEGLSAFLVMSPRLATVLGEVCEPEDVAKIILGKHPKTCFNQLIHSDMDVDSMDYLRRDAKATGINYGEFSLSYLLGNLELRESSTRPTLLCVNEKALHTVEHFVLARYFYYLQILYHRKRRIYDHLTHICAKWMLDDGYLPTLKRLDRWILDGPFEGFNDYYFFTQLARYANRRRSSSVKAALCRILLNREHIRLEYNKVEMRRAENFASLKDRALDRVKQLRRSNLLEEKDIKDPIGNSHPDFPLVIETRELYADVKKTNKKLSEQAEDIKGRIMPVEERDTIKVARKSGHIVNINSMKESLIRQLAGHCTVLVRYYYIPKDRMR